MKNWKLYQALHARGVKLDALAADLGTTKSHLSEVFNGKRGAHSRKHIVKHLTPAERALLGWDERGDLVPTSVIRNSRITAEQVRTCENVPRETSSQLRT